MTPTERVETIIELCGLTPSRLMDVTIDKIAAEIAAAVAIARDEACADRSHVTHEQFLDYAKQVRSDAYQDAAKIADEQSEIDRGFGGGCECGKAIRSRAAERGRQCDQYHCGHDSCNAARAAELLTNPKPDGD